MFGANLALEDVCVLFIVVQVQSLGPFRRDY